MTDTQVVIAGAGPTGLMLACELRLAGVDVLVLERLPEPRTVESRAGGLHIRTMETLDQRGLLDRFLERGRRRQGVHFSALPLDVSDVTTRHPYVLVIVQSEVEQLLAERAADVGVRLRRGADVAGFVQDETGVTVALADGSRVRADYLVGCDGGRSTVRGRAGIEFPGTPATMTALLGDVELAEPPADDIFQERREHGSFSVLSFGPDWYRVLTNEFDHVADRDEPMTLETLRTTLLKIAGTDYGMHSPRWLSRHGDAARQADRYREGRVLLAGDAAHIHFPAGGQGLNTGVQDAVNLGWKLAAVVLGQAPDLLLDTYEAERHPVAARVLQNTRAQTALFRVDEHTSALRKVLGDRRLRINTGDREERPHARADQIPVLACRMRPADGVLIITAAYTGMRWGELAGLQWSRVDLDGGAIRVDPKDGALHEVGGRLALGPPKTTAGVRTVHLPPFLAELLGEHRERHPRARFVFTAAEGGWHRRANFRRRAWLPAVEGDPKRGWAPIASGLHFHDLRHTHKTWLIEDGVPEVVQHKRLGHKLGGVRGVYSHVTAPMVTGMCADLQARWEQNGSTIWDDHYLNGSVVKINCSQLLPPTQNSPLAMITNRLSDQGVFLVGDTGIEPVTPTVSRLPSHIAHLGCKLFAQVSAPHWSLLPRVLTRSDGLSSPKYRPLIMNVRTRCVQMWTVRRGSADGARGRGGG